MTTTERTRTVPVRTWITEDAYRRLLSIADRRRTTVADLLAELARHATTPKPAPTPSPGPTDSAPARRTRRKMSPDMIATARQRRANGDAPSEIARDLGVHPRTVARYAPKEGNRNADHQA
jgi:DNA invertase Pin-like site-specific DNA recombinase